MRPVLCMVTAPLVSVAEEELLIQRIASAARAGVHLIQVRQNRLEARALANLVERAGAATSGTSARVLVNDRVDVAVAVRGHGVHLRGDSMPGPRVRPIAPPGFLIGRSVHTVEEARAAEQAGGLDYLLFGTVFPSASKPGMAPAGLERLAEVCRSVTLPVLAIGGVTESTVAAVARAGAAGFAAIGFFATPPPETMTERIGHAIAAFDTSGSRSLT